MASNLLKVNFKKGTVRRGNGKAEAVERRSWEETIDLDSVEKRNILEERQRHNDRVYRKGNVNGRRW